MSESIDYDDLCKRLREDASRWSDDMVMASLEREAADSIVALAALREQVAAKDADIAAIRELMNVYNLGGWTDAIAPMKRALAAEADNAALRQDAERLDWLDLQADDWTYKGSKVWKIVGPKLSIREVIDSVRPMRQDDAAMREGKG